MAGVPVSTPSAPWPSAGHTARYVISRRDGRTHVEVDGKPIRLLTGLSVSFEPNAFPRRHMSLALDGGDLALDEACLLVDFVEIPDAPARAVYEHLRARFESRALL